MRHSLQVGEVSCAVMQLLDLNFLVSCFLVYFLAVVFVALLCLLSFLVVSPASSLNLVSLADAQVCGEFEEHAAIAADVQARPAYGRPAPPQDAVCFSLRQLVIH